MKICPLHLPTRLPFDCLRCPATTFVAWSVLIMAERRSEDSLGFEY